MFQSVDANERRKNGRGVLKWLKVGKKHFENGSEKLSIDFSLLQKFFLQTVQKRHHRRFREPSEFMSQYWHEVIIDGFRTVCNAYYHRQLLTQNRLW